jgi:hypothetical protein
MTHQHANYKQLRTLRRTGAFQGNNHATMPSKWLIIAFIGTIAQIDCNNLADDYLAVNNI